MNKKRFRKKNSLTSFFNKTGLLKGLGAVLVLSLLFFYIFQVAEMTRSIHSIQAYNRKVREVLEENRRNEYDFLRANSVSRAEELVGEMDFVKVESVSYIDILDYQIASR